MKTKLLILLLLTFVLSLPTVLGDDIYYRGKISAYRVMQKSKSALYDTGSYEKIIEEWYQGPYVHRKSKYTQRVKDLTDLAVEGRVSYSYYGFDSGDSDSFWVQSYTIRGVPFSWNSKKKKWKNEVLDIEDKYARERISYSFLHQLGGIDLGGIDPDSLEFLGEEEKNGKICYLVSYRYLSDMLKSWGLMGKLGAKLWVEKETFLPVKKRVEGNIAGMNSLVVVSYQKYGQHFDFQLPDYIVEESAKEKKALEDKVDEVIAQVAKLRGWQAEEIKDFKVEFAKKNRIKEELLKDRQERYSEEEISYDGQLLKWLGLIPKDADYSDLIFDSSDVGFIAGLYLPRIKTMFVADNLDPAQAELTLFHEAVHAFQDKKLDFQKKFDALKNDMNAFRAFMCFIEGEAASLQLEYLLNKSDETLKEWEDISSLIDQKVVHGYSRNKVFYNVYGYGAMFIQDYLKRNSWDWRKLDAVYRDYPEAMEEIIHPDEYNMKAVIRKIAKDSKSVAKLASLKIDDWEPVYTNKLGEYHLFLMLDEKLDRKQSEPASIGWNDDRVDIYQKGDQGQLIILLTKWDTPKDASEFSEAYKDWLKEKEFTPYSEDSDNNLFVNSTEGQSTACLLGGNRVTVIGSQDVSQDTFESIINQIVSKKTARVTSDNQPQDEEVLSKELTSDIVVGKNKPSAPLGAVLISAMAALMIPFLILYVYLAITLQIIAKRTSTKSGWMAWVPILNLLLMVRIAQKPGWWLILFFVPLVSIVICVIVFIEIAKQCGKPAWLGALMLLPVVNLFVLGYLAFSSKAAKSVKEKPEQPQTEVNKDQSNNQVKDESGNEQ